MINGLLNIKFSYGLVLGIFIVLFVYHFLIWIDRKDNLNGAYTAFCFSSILYILFLRIIPSIYQGSLIINAIGTFSIVTFSASILLFSSCVFKLGKIVKITGFFLIVVSLCSVILSLFSIITNNPIYIKIFDIISGVFALYFFLTLIIMAIVTKQYNTETKKLVLIGIILMLFGVSYAAIIAGIKEQANFYIAYSPLLIMNFLFARASTLEFNNEHRRLIELSKTLEQKVKDRTQELAEANEIKTTFFINLAHETKTPLTLILNYLDSYMNDQKINSEELEIVRQNLHKLSTDMVNYLDSEKIERGEELHIHDKIFNVSDLLSNEVRLFQKTAEKKGIFLHSQIEKSITIKANDIALCRVIRNILENAIKYTNKEGSIFITMKTVNGLINLVIADSGIGIPAEQMDNIFKPYYQVGGRKHNYQGSGMGLSIVKGIIDSLNGQISVESKEDKGTTVKVVLPEYNLKVTETVDTCEIPGKFYELSVFDLEEEIIDKGLPKILLVEDEMAIISLLKKELGSDYNLFYAVNGQEALKRLPEIVPDLIISDVMMDIMDGFDFVSQIPEAYQDIPFIFLTARTGLRDKINGLDRGAIDYVYKPFALEEIKHKIKNHLEQKEQVRNKVLMKLGEYVRDKTPVKTSFSSFCLRQGITPKEKQVILLVNDEMQNKEIAYEMSITVGTVKTHLNSIFSKLKIANRVGIVKKLRNLDLST